VNTKPIKYIFLIFALALPSLGEKTLAYDLRQKANFPVKLSTDFLETETYIVTLEDDVLVQEFVFTLKKTGVNVLRVFNLATNAFVAELTDADLQKLKENEQVKSFEKDEEVFLSGEQSLLDSSGALTLWNLDRIDQHNSALDGIYSYDTTGDGVTAYVVDTGINSGHEEFTGRVNQGYNIVADAYETEDCNGHGTHVSGILGGTKYGVAKDVTITPVRVLNCRGSGSISGVISGINWVIANHSSGTPAVMNFSLVVSSSMSLNDAVRSAIEDGITVVAAAGNANTSACNYSPGSEPLVITVGSITSLNEKSGFSNYGPCLDIFAPGSSIDSAWVGASNSAKSSSGTSMASPHVAGVAALLLESSPSASHTEVAESIIAMATTGVVNAAETNSPNIQLFNGSSGPSSPTTTTTTTTTTSTSSTTTSTTTVPLTENAATTTTSTIPSTTTTTLPLNTTTSTSTTSTTTLVPTTTSTTTTVPQTTTTLAPTTTTTVPASTTTSTSTTTSSTTTTTVPKIIGGGTSTGGGGDSGGGDSGGGDSGEAPVTTTTTTPSPTTTTTIQVPTTTTVLAPMPSAPLGTSPLPVKATAPLRACNKVNARKTINKVNARKNINKVNFVCRKINGKLVWYKYIPIKPMRRR